MAISSIATTVLSNLGLSNNQSVIVRVVVAIEIDWDFILVHSDESVVRLHPDWKSTKFLVFVVEGHAEPVEIPQRGLEV